MKISKSRLEEVVKAQYALRLPEYVDAAYMQCLLNGEDTAEVPDSFERDVEEVVREYETEQQEVEARRSEESEVSKHRLAGMEKERISDNEGAMSEYAIAIILGEQSRFDLFHSYAHAYERLIVCLHKAKKYAKEAGYIERYLKYNLPEATRSKYSARLEKLKSKINIA